MRRNTVQPDTPPITIRRTRIAFWIPKPTNTHLEYAIFIVFPLQQWLYESAPILSSINFEAVTNLMHKYLYSYNITILYMFRALLCSTSGGSIVYVQHLVPSLSVTAQDAVHIQLNLLKLSIIMLETYRGL